MKSEELRKRLEDEAVATREEVQFWLGKMDEARDNMDEAHQYLKQLEALLSFWEQPGERVQAIPMFTHEGEHHSRYEDLSIADAAFEVLKEAPMPLHAKRILTAILVGGKAISSKTPLISVTSTLIRDDRFENLGGNTWRIKDSAGEVDEKS